MHFLVPFCLLGWDHRQGPPSYVLCCRMRQYFIQIFASAASFVFRAPRCAFALVARPPPFLLLLSPVRSCRIGQGHCPPPLFATPPCAISPRQAILSHPILLLPPTAKQRSVGIDGRPLPPFSSAVRSVPSLFLPLPPSPPA